MKLSSKLCALILLSVIFRDASGAERPNILFVISDDQSYPHASAYGCRWVNTPAFDRVAKEGILFHNAITPTPGCSPTRASVLTGRHAWQIESAGTHASAFPSKFETFPDTLEKHGYFVGHTGKGWAPGNWKASGRTRNPAGPAFTARKQKSPSGISSNDYSGNFEDFLEARPKDTPFCFWLGTSEPHRAFDRGAGTRAGKRMEDVDVPAFLPDTPLVRSDLLDYAVEIEWFDKHLGRALSHLEATGELDNTLVIVTSDNGMAFPRAKANLFEYGTHVPLAIRWGKIAKPGRDSKDLIGFVDLTATILRAAGLKVDPKTYAGRPLQNIFASEASGVIDPTRDAAFSARERHSSSRYRSLGYPQRSIRTAKHLYIRNYSPERWPAGTPQKFGKGNYPSGQDARESVLGPQHGGYHDIDACPTLTEMIVRREEPFIGRLLAASVQKRPADELYDLSVDAACLKNLAGQAEHASTLKTLSTRLSKFLSDTGDPRATGKGHVFETYPRYSRIRLFPTPPWAKSNPSLVPKQDWLEKRIESLKAPAPRR